MTRQARIAWCLCGLTVVLGLVHTWLFLGWSAGRTDTNGWPIVTVGVMFGSALGAMIITRRPGHLIGWLFLVGTLGAAIGNPLFAYDAIVMSSPDAEPEASWQIAVWVAFFFDVPEPLLFATLLFLLYPDGHLPSRRWRWLLWASWTTFALFVVTLAVALPPWQIRPENRDDDLFGSQTSVVIVVLLMAMLVELLAAVVAVVLRLRRARGVERQQLRWLAVGAAMVGLGFALAVFLPGEHGFASWLRTLPLHLGFVAVIAGAGLAVLRYRLYDLDIVVSRALLLTLASGTVALGYVAVVVVIGAAAPDPVTDAFWPSLLAMVLVALAFQPLRSRIVRLADRMAFGRRAAPYEALASFAHSLDEAPGQGDLLRQVAAGVGEATGARDVTAVLELPDGTETSVIWPARELSAAAPTVLAVEDKGDRLGRVEVRMPPGRPLREDERLLAQRLLDQSALALRNLRLETELAAQVEQLDRHTTALADSRRRMLAARDEEKSRFAAALRRRVLPHIDPLPGNLLSVAARADVSGVDAQALEEAQTAATEALDELRRLVRGFGPDGQAAGAPGQRAAASQARVSSSGPNADLVT